jgi:hypothetical protein
MARVKPGQDGGGSEASPKQATQQLTDTLEPDIVLQKAEACAISFPLSDSRRPRPGAGGKERGRAVQLERETKRTGRFFDSNRP